MTRKATFAVSVGALVITTLIIITGLFVYNNSFNFTGKAIGEAASAGMSNQQTIKREEVKQALTSAFIQALKEVEFNGGYPKGYQGTYYPSKSMDYAMNYVALYRVCGENHYPSLSEIKDSLEKRTAYYFHKKMQTYEKQDKDFKFYGINALSLNILDDKVQILADINIEYKGMALPSDYFVEVPTRLKEIHEFATNFTEMMSKLRLTDFYMINLLYSADPYYLPTGGILTKCGDSMSLSAVELTDHFYRLYGYLLSNIDFFKPLNLEPEDPPHYNLIKVGATESLLKDYKGLSVVLRKPDDFTFKFNKGIHVSNNIWLSYNPFAPVAECIQRYDFSYSFPFAYIVSVKDDLVGGDAVYNFAEFSMIENMVPKEDCGYDDYPDNELVYAPTVLDGIADNSNPYTPSSPSYQGECSPTGMELTVRVRDKSTGEFIEEANVYYKGCYVGQTDSNGYLKFKIPSNSNDPLFVVEKEGYIFYYDRVDPSKLSLINVVLAPLKERKVDVKFIVAHANLEPKPYYDDEDIINPNYGYSLDVSSHIPGLGSSNALLWLDYCEVKDELDENYEGIVAFSEDDLLVYDPTQLNENENMEEKVTSYLTKDNIAFVNALDINSKNKNYEIELPPLNLYVRAQLFSSLPATFNQESVNINNEVSYLSDVQFIMLSNDASHITLYIPVVKVEKIQTAHDYVSNGYLNVYKVAAGKYGLDDFNAQYNFYKKDLVNLVKEGCGMKLYGRQSYKRTYSLNLGLPNSYVCKRLKTIAFTCDPETYNLLKSQDVDSCLLNDGYCCNVGEVVNKMRQNGCNIVAVNHKIG